MDTLKKKNEETRKRIAEAKKRAEEEKRRLAEEGRKATQEKAAQTETKTATAGKTPSTEAFKRQGTKWSDLQKEQPCQRKNAIYCWP